MNYKIIDTPKIKNVKEAEARIKAIKLDLIQLIPNIVLVDIQEQLAAGEDVEVLVKVSMKDLQNILHK
jgi:hypothetical protein